MRTSSRSLLSILAKTTVVAAMTVLIMLAEPAPATAQLAKIKVGKTIGGSGFHIPSYVAVDKGFFKGEGLDADFISTTAGVLVRPAIAKELECVPMPGVGS